MKPVFVHRVNHNRKLMKINKKKQKLVTGWVIILVSNTEKREWKLWSFNKFVPQLSLVICLSFYVLFLILFYLCAIAIWSYDRKF